MIRVSTGLTGLAFLAVCSVALAADKDASTAHAPSLKTESTIKAATKLPVAAPALFGKPVSLRGTLGAVQVQVNVRPKAEIDEGIEGEYFVFGRSQKILLAGELEGEDVFLEESENGTDVSGQWDGKHIGDTIQGIWLSADGLISKPFTLQVVQAQVPRGKAKPLPVKPAKPMRTDQ